MYRYTVQQIHILNLVLQFDISTPAFQALPLVTLDMINDWLETARARVNPAQFNFLQLVADRLKVELNLITPEESLRPNGDEPLRYLLHGPPGTGKSHVSKLVQELFQLVGYKKGREWQFMAFQATNAADLDGDTIHHSVGLSINPNSFDKPVSNEVAKRMATWRWIFLDEISMTPAQLLALMEHRLVQTKPSGDPFKHDPATGEVRPFAGINFVGIGDFKQLPPPQGGYLASIPFRHLVGPNDPTRVPDVLVDAGQRLVWEQIQGAVELTERERCKDEWWNEVTDELRANRLSDKNYNYLHGIPVAGCKLSAEERASRCRLITGPQDPRLQEAKFREAPLIVANNDSKYQVNKDRAKKYAKDAGAELRWSIAKDVASNEALQAQVCDKGRKIKSLGCKETVLAI